MIPANPNPMHRLMMVCRSNRPRYCNARTDGDHAIRIFCQQAYDSNWVQRTIQAWLYLKNCAMLMWGNSLNFAKIIRRKNGQEHDGSEVRNSHIANQYKTRVNLFWRENAGNSRITVAVKRELIRYCEVLRPRR